MGLAATFAKPQMTEQQTMLAKQILGNEGFARGNTPDYDLQKWMNHYGTDLNSVGAQWSDPTGAHFNDVGKLPNHYTFSNESDYSNDKTPGGTWVQGQGGKWTFNASPFNMSQHTPEEMQEYFKKVEPNSTLVLPSAEAMKQWQAQQGQLPSGLASKMVGNNGR